MTYRVIIIIFPQTVFHQDNRHCQMTQLVGLHKNLFHHRHHFYHGQIPHCLSHIKFVFYMMVCRVLLFFCLYNLFGSTTDYRHRLIGDARRLTRHRLNDRGLRLRHSFSFTGTYIVVLFLLVRFFVFLEAVTALSASSSL
jgi:hypothetical protein